MPAGVAFGFAAERAAGGTVGISLALGTAVGAGRSQRLGSIVPAVVGISDLAFGRAVGKGRLAAVRRRYGSTVMTVVRISNLTLGRTV